MRVGILFLTLCICGLQAEEQAGEAKVTAVRNQVEKTQGGTNQAIDVGHGVRAGEPIQTGAQGLVEVKDPKGGTVRMGENSRASYDSSTRKVQVDKGTVLIQADPKNGPIQVESGGVKIEVEGK